MSKRSLRVAYALAGASRYQKLRVGQGWLTNELAYFFERSTVSMPWFFGTRSSFHEAAVSPRRRMAAWTALRMTVRRGFWAARTLQNRRFWESKMRRTKCAFQRFHWLRFRSEKAEKAGIEPECGDSTKQPDCQDVHVLSPLFHIIWLA